MAFSVIPTSWLLLHILEWQKSHWRVKSEPLCTHSLTQRDNREWAHRRGAVAALCCGREGASSPLRRCSLARSVSIFYYVVVGALFGRRDAGRRSRARVSWHSERAMWKSTSTQNVRRVSQTRHRRLQLLRCGRENRPAVWLEADLQDRETAAGHRPHQHAGKSAPAEKRECALKNYIIATCCVSNGPK